MGTLFGYALSPDSVPCGATGVELTLKVSNETGPDQDCAAIQFTLPAGLSGDLGSVGAAALSGTPWSITSEGDGVFQAEPQPPATGIGAGDAIGFTFSGIKTSSTPANLELAVAQAAGGATSVPVALAKDPFGITQFTASAVQVAHDTPVTLSWNASEATGCSLSWDGGHVDGKANDSYTDRPTVTTTYTLTASGAGQPVQAQITVTVATPQVISFGGTPVNVAMGGDVLLTWEAIHAARCTLTFFPSDKSPQPPVIELPPQSAGFVVNPQISGTYHFEAIGEGRTDERDQPVTVESVVLTSFSATPTTIDPGASSTLAWVTEWASKVEIDPGVGTVTATGSKVVTPAAETTYTLAAGGFEPKQAKAPVAVVPRITMFTLDIGSKELDVSWASVGAQSATLNGGSVPATGSSRIDTGADTGTHSGQLAVSSEMGAQAVISFSTWSATVESDWVPCVAFTSTAPGGINLPGPVTIQWNDDLPNHQTWSFDTLGGSASTAAGASTGVGPALSGQQQLVVAAAPSGASELWQASLASGNKWWAASWSVALNRPAPKQPTGRDSQ